MSDDDLKVYVQARPYIRALLALVFYICDRKNLTRDQMGAKFTEADMFLTEFEQRRS